MHSPTSQLSSPPVMFKNTSSETSGNYLLDICEISFISSFYLKSVSMKALQHRGNERYITAGHFILHHNPPWVFLLFFLF